MAKGENKLPGRIQGSSFFLFFFLSRSEREERKKVLKNPNSKGTTIDLKCNC